MLPFPAHQSSVVTKCKPKYRICRQVRVYQKTTKAPETDQEKKRRKLLEEELKMEYKLPEGDLTPAKIPRTANQAMVEGVVKCKQGDYEEAYKLIMYGMELNPRKDIKGKLIYNLGCCYAKFRMWKESAECIKEVINDYNASLSVALKDDDLIFLRERVEWLDTLATVRGGYSQKFRVDLKTENRTPVRSPRFFVYGVFSVASMIGVPFLITRFIKALKGIETVGPVAVEGRNLAVNIVVIVVALTLWWQESKVESKVKQKVWRQEDLARLQARVPGGRVVPLVTLQQNCRLLIFAGSRRYVQEMVYMSDSVYPQLRERGVSILPIILEDKDIRDEMDALKVELNEAKQEKYEQGFGLKKIKTIKNPVNLDELKKLSQFDDKTWILAPYRLAEWAQYLDQQKEAAKIKRQNVYIQVGLDGFVVFSGTGEAPFQSIIADTPPLKSLKTKLTDQELF